jgi:two-component system, OmpR family, phosphate regulon response regulator PhoB
MPRVLLIEDDGSLGVTLAERLEREGLTVAWARTVSEARAQLQTGPWDLAIVDVKLPDGSGFGLAREMRSRSATPIMFMTALNSAESRLEGFEIGADEYLPKPFHLREFMLRVRHVLGRQRAQRTIEAGGCRIDLGAMSVDRPGRERAFLQARDCQVLKLLIDAAPRVVARSEILDRVWGENRFPTPRAVDNAIVRLRQAIGDDQGQLIRSIRGVGYQWAVEAE